MASTHGRQHMPRQQQHMVMPQRQCLLRRLSDLGLGGTKADLRVPRGVPVPQLVLPTWFTGPTLGVVPPQGLPPTSMDSLHQPPRPTRRHGQYATRYAAQLHVVDSGGDHLQLLRF